MRGVYREVQKTYDRLFLSIGLGEFAVSLVGIVDMIAVAQLGIATIAGYAYAIAIVPILYLNYDAINIFGYVEYTKERDTSVLSSLKKMGMITQILLTLLMLFLAIFIVLFSGLSSDANQIVFQVLLVRSIGAFFFIQSTVYYIYLRTEKREKIATFARCVCFVFNTIFDILAIIFGYGVLGVVSATLIGEFLEYLFIKFYFCINKINFNNSKKGQMRDYWSNYLSGYLVGIAQKSQFLLAGVITSWMGDELYAIYGILCSSISQFLWFSDVSGTIVETVYAEFKDKIEDKVKLFKKLLIAPLKVLSIYTLFSLGILPIIYKILTIQSGVELNYLLLVFLLIYLIFMESYYFFFGGILCILEEYKLYRKTELICVPVAALIEILILSLKNPYLSYCLGWTVTYCIIFVVAYRKGIKKFKSMF